MLLKIACALLLTAGLFLLLNIQPRDFAQVLFKPILRRRRRSQRIRALTGAKNGPVQRQIEAARLMLEQSGMDDKSVGYTWAAIILAALGLLIGIWMDNLLAAIVLAAGLAALPLIVIFFRTGEYTRALAEKLETAMGILTNTYVQTGDFIGAVESSISLLPAPLDGIFRRYLAQTRLIDSSQERALSNLRSQINNRHWQDWCSILIQCSHDRQLRFALPGIVERLGETRRIQMEMDTAFQKHFSDYIITVLIVLGSIPMMALMMPQWYDMLMTTLPGKITLAVVLAAVLFTGFWVSRINRPIEK